MYFWVLLSTSPSPTPVFPDSVLFLALGVWASSLYLLIWTDTGRGCRIETCLESLWKALVEQQSRGWARLSSWQSEPPSICATFHLGCTKELEKPAWNWSQTTHKRQNLGIIGEHGSSARFIIWHCEVRVALKVRLMCIWWWKKFQLHHQLSTDLHMYLHYTEVKW